MNILFRAIITGFGLRMGSEIARGIATKLKERSNEDEQEADEKEAAEEDDELGSITPDPPQV